MKPSVVNIDVNLTDIVTPKTCCVLICELIKHLIYHREQIPYTYERLKFLITRRKEMNAVPTEAEEEDGQISLHSRIAAERHFCKAEETFQNLENAFKDIEVVLLEQCNNAVEEVLVILGNTPVHPQNIFRIPIPVLSLDHKEENHPSRKNLPSLFQALISEKLHVALSKKICPTNVFILLKTKDTSNLQSETFEQKETYKIPVRATLVNFLLKTDNVQSNCTCTSDFGFPVFCDTPSRHFNVVNNVVYSQPINRDKLVPSTSNNNNNNTRIEEDDDDDDSPCWFQFSQSIKGFKDCKIDGTSAANIWLKYKKPYDLIS